MEGLSYVEITFNDQEVQSFKELVNSVCKPEDFYYSDTISRIHGDVTEKLHFTLYYGLIDQQINEKEIKNHLSTLDIKSIRLGKPFLKVGFKGLYKVLMIEVLDEDKKLEEAHNSLKQFAHMETSQIFLPHITLAYVQPEYEIGDVSGYPTELTVKRIRYSEDRD
jgi:2'-5' RNA ligase